MLSRLALPLCLLLLAGCSSTRATSPSRSAQEVLLITTAADRAAEALAEQVPTNLTAWIDPSGFSAEDQAYGLAAIKDALLRHGVRLVSDQTKADAVILPRAGTLSTDEKNTLVGIPSLPVPLAPGVLIPPLSLYSENSAKGAAKFAASIYDPKTGKLIVSTNPAYGFSRENDGVVLFFFSWRKNDMDIDLAKNPPRVTAAK
ncbi:MAG TPA: hypothetical protein VGH23_05445 [Rhizomicrobium sp.]|jgi:hypothetical protein